MKAFDFAGKEVWTRDIPKDHGAFGIQFGYASSPLLHGDALYLQVLHGFHTDDPSYVLKIDKMTGKSVWRTERPTNALHESPDSYSTPALLAELAREVVSVERHANLNTIPRLVFQILSRRLRSKPRIPPG